MISMHAYVLLFLIITFYSSHGKKESWNYLPKSIVLNYTGNTLSYIVFFKHLKIVKSNKHTQEKYLLVILSRSMRVISTICHFQKSTFSKLKSFSWKEIGSFCSYASIAWLCVFNNIYIIDKYNSILTFIFWHLILSCHF